MIIYKDILAKMKAAGYSTARIRKEKILSESTLTKIRNNKAITTDTLDVICGITKLPVEELMEYREE